MTLGTPGEQGNGPNNFTSPSDVAIASNGDVFIADGHNANGNNRVVKYNSRGEFLMTWGETGYAPGQFRARPRQPSDRYLRPRRQPLCNLDSVRAPERNRL